MRNEGRWEGWCGQRWQWQQSKRAVSAGNRFRKAKAAASLSRLRLPFVALIGVRRCNIGNICSHSILPIPIPLPLLSLSLSPFLDLCFWDCACVFVPTGCALATATYSRSVSVYPFSIHLHTPFLPLFYILSFFLSFFIHSPRSLILIIVSFSHALFRFPRAASIHFVLCYATLLHLE